MKQAPAIALVVLVMAFLGGLPSHAATSFCSIDLSGSHKFSAGDDMRWARPELDDSGWTSIQVPGGWQSQGFDPENGLGWYRMHFPVPDDFHVTSPALLLGRIVSADEVFLNGERIGGEGVIGDEFVEAYRKHRFYRIPQGLLRAGSDNVISVRVLNTWHEGGIVNGPVCIGEYERLLAEASFNDYIGKTSETVLVAFCFFAALTALILYRIDPEEREYLFFAAFLLNGAICGGLDSLTFYDSGLKSFWSTRIVSATACIYPACILGFVSSFNREPLKLPDKVLILFLALLASASFIVSTLRGYFIIMNIFNLLVIPAVALVLFHAIRAYRKEYHEAGYMMVRIGLFVLDGSLRTVGVEILRIPNSVAFDWGAAGLQVCGAFGLIARYARTREKLKLLSGRILDAHEEERRRLSREIHDGVGQSLQSVKLYLQMMEAGKKSGCPLGEDVLPTLISEVSGSIEELRSVAMALRPSELEMATLAETLAWYGRKFSEKLDIRFEMKNDESIDAPIRIKDHLYRIYQEALTNIGKHAQAGLICVELKRSKKRLLLTITDNGKGFEPAAGAGRNSGLGLSTMKERAELLGGVFHITSSPGKGARIDIEVPIP